MNERAADGRMDANARLAELRCSQCNAELTAGGAGLTCSQCRRTFHSVNGIIDLRVQQRDAQPGPLNEEAMRRSAVAPGPADWPRMVREFIGHVQDVPAWLDVLTGDGRFAWKLLLDLAPDQIVLDLGCGYGSAAGNIAPHVARTYTMGLDFQELEFARQRLSIWNSGDDITLIAGGDAGRLPFADSCFDVVLLPGGLECLQPVDGKPSSWSVTGLLGEIRRVLKADGQFFWAADNLLGYPGFASGRSVAGVLRSMLRPQRFDRPGRFPGRTWQGYRSSLHAAGFNSVEMLGLTPDRAYAEHLLPADLPISYWPAVAPTGIKARIRQSKYFVPAYGIIAGNLQAGGPMRLLDRLATRISHDLDCDIADFEIRDFAVSRKHKAIIKARVSDRLVYLRVPMSPAALRAETDNRNQLIHLRENLQIADMVPQPLAAGQLRSLFYFVESHVAGSPAYMSAGSVPMDVHLQDVEQFLYRLNPGAPRRESLTGARYEQLVGARLAGLHDLLDRDAMHRLQVLFDEQVRGVDVVQGISHGDFGVNNLFLDAHGSICGLIDWEYGLPDGLPVLDAINYVLISHRVRHAGDSVVNCMAWLATNRWPDARQTDFLGNYFAHTGLDMADIKAFTLLWWLYVITYRIKSGMACDPDAIRSYLTDVMREFV